MGIAIGQIIDGKYRVTAQIGEGGMGAVYAGEHLKLHRKVAIKTLHPAVSQDPQVVTRFEREAQAAGRIGNDHILEVFDIGELPGGDRYMVMEFLDGEAMNTRLARLQRLTPQQIYPLVKQMLEGLAAAHAAGIVHRDLKPANVFILREKAGVRDYVKIIDFGISKFKTLGNDASQTRTGTIIGTPAYMSPEQARGLREADARSDIYAVGIIMYEAATGRVPFEGASTNDLLFKIFLNEVPPIASVAPDVDPAFGSLVMKALAKDPNDRFASSDEFVASLDAWARTGSGVHLPKPTDPTNTILEGPRAPRPSGITAPPGMAPTVGAWEEARTASPATQTRTRPRAPIAAGIGILFLALLAGGALYKLGAKPDGGLAAGPQVAGASAASAGTSPGARMALPSSATVDAPPPATSAAAALSTLAGAGTAGGSLDAAAPPHTIASATPPPAETARPTDDGHHHSHRPAPTSQPGRQTSNPLDQL